MNRLAATDVDGREALMKFQDALKRDARLLDAKPWLGKWLLAENHEVRQTRGDMNFKNFEGHDHVRKFLTWNVQLKGKDYFPSAMISELARISLDRDMRAAQELGISVNPEAVAITGRYNAQDYLFQRLYPVPPHQTIRNILDFGGGLGRMANLAFGAPETTVKSMVGIDGIPSTYLTQRIYYTALGLTSVDYIDASNPDDFDVASLMKEKQVVHLPTWKMEMVPSASIDLVICAQVLRELPQELFVHAARQFARVLQPGGALYVRDHYQQHNPNQMPQDEILQACGFLLEFRPHVHDRVDIHGIPRIWRKFNPKNYFKGASVESSEASRAPADEASRAARIARRDARKRRQEA